MGAHWLRQCTGVLQDFILGEMIIRDNFPGIQKRQNYMLKGHTMFLDILAQNDQHRHILEKLLDFEKKKNPLGILKKARYLYRKEY